MTTNGSHGILGRNFAELGGFFLWQVPEPQEVREGGICLGMGLAGKSLNMEGLNGKPYKYYKWCILHHA